MIISSLPLRKKLAAETKPVEASHLEDSGSLPQRKWRKPIPAAIARPVRARDQNRCVWNLPDGSKCNSTWKTQLDHKRPHALGGLDTEENLRVLCASHNAFYATQTFGAEVMERFQLTSS